jgi:hypothetical protein
MMMHRAHRVTAESTGAVLYLQRCQQSGLATEGVKG